MSQGAIVIASGTGLEVRTAINAAFARLQTGASGTSRPSDIGAGESWFETDNPGSGTWSLWLYDGTGDALIGTLNTSTHKFTDATSPTTTQGDIIQRGASGDQRLAIGAAFSLLQVNAAANAVAWQKGGWVKVADDATPTSAGTFSVTGIASTVKHLKVLFDLRPVTDAVNLELQISQGLGIQTSSDYRYGHKGVAEDGTTANAGGTAQSKILLSLSARAVENSGVDLPVFGEILFPSIQVQGFKTAFFRTRYAASDGSGLWGVSGWGGCFLSGDPMDGYRLQFSSGNIALGHVTTLGIQG